MIDVGQVRAVRRDRATGWRRWRFAAVLLAVALLYFVYWRLSWSAAADSDAAASALQARDVLHGNVLLHGWMVSDVSFYTTEIPQYALLELALGFGAGVVHVAAAMSNTLIAVLVALLAAGPAFGVSGRERMVRAVIAFVIVVAPQASAAMVLLRGPDHTGTMVPVLAVWLLIDRCGGRCRPPVFLPVFLPVFVAVAIAWIMVADTIVVLTVIVPLIVAALVRAVWSLVRRPAPVRPVRRAELWLALAAGVGAVLGVLATHVIGWLGGYGTWGVGTQVMPLSTMQHHAWNVLQAVLTLFGADVVTVQSPVQAILCWLHMAGLLLAVAGFGIAVARFFRSDSIVPAALAVAIPLELGTYLVSAHSIGLGSIREIVAVLPFGAVLAGRGFSAVSPRSVVAALAGVVVLVGYVGGLAYDATRAAVPSQNQDVATWLQAHQLSAGLAPYWQAEITTLDTGGAVQVGAVVITGEGKLHLYDWEASAADFDPAKRDARFVIVNGPAALQPIAGLGQAAIRTFGAPARTYQVGSSTILVWNHNILSQLPGHT